MMLAHMDGCCTWSGNWFCPGCRTVVVAYLFTLVDGGGPGKVQGLTLWTLAAEDGKAGGSSSSGSEERLLEQEEMPEAVKEGL